MLALRRTGRTDCPSLPGDVVVAGGPMHVSRERRPSRRGDHRRCNRHPDSSRRAAGTITSLLTVATGQGTLEIHGLKPAGKRSMSWQDFVNGRHVRPGDRFEAIHA